jgi:hypothetical protein
MMAYGEKGESKDHQFETLKGWYRADVVKANKWRKNAVEDFKFRDGDQWTDEEKSFLESQMRPVVVFNRTGVLVDAVVGSEIGNRREVRYIPRELADAKPNELLTSAAEWFRDQCDAEDEESEAFKDTVTAGMGWTDTRMDYEDNPAGDAKVDKIDPMEMVWDCHASKANLVDTKRRWRVRKMALEAAEALLPGVDPDLINAAWAENDAEDTEPHRNNPGEQYNEDGTSKEPSKDVTVVACQYFEKETYYQAVILNPETGQQQEIELDEEKYKVAVGNPALLKAVKRTRKQVVQCFLGANSIIKKATPTQTGSFTWNCITGLKDHDQGIFYGIVRRAKDPQRWANKWLSQMMHILNSQAKGGIMAEDGAFEDVRQAERDWAKPEAIVKLVEGALSGPNPKIQPKPVAAFPAGFDRLLQYADDMIIKATGINMELLGMREVNQPGVLEYQRKQQGIAILASFFDSLRRYRKIQGRAMLHLIQNYLADGRKVRIVGDDQAQYVPLMAQQIANVEYDIIVDDAPSSTNEKEKTFQIIQQMLPLLKDQMTPAMGMLIAEYSPLPTSFIEKSKALMAQQEEQGPDPLQQQAMQLEQLKMQNAGREIELQMMQEQNKAAELQFKMAELQQKGATSVMEQQTERERIGVDRIEAFASLRAAENPPQPAKAN